MIPKKVYLAAKYSRREEMEVLACDLPAIGLECNARWVYGAEEKYLEDDPKEKMTRREIAVMDLEDVSNADILILFTHERSSPQPGGGRFVEFGYALARGLRCIVIGPAENVFTEAPGVDRYDDWQSFLKAEGVPYWKSKESFNTLFGLPASG